MQLFNFINLNFIATYCWDQKTTKKDTNSQIQNYESDKINLGTIKFKDHKKLL